MPSLSLFSNLITSAFAGIFPASTPNPRQPRPAPHRPQGDATAPDHLLILPCPPLPDDERQTVRHHDLGRFLARQERWEDLAGQIITADQQRQSTPDGHAVATLLAAGARADVVHAFEEARLDGKTPSLAGIQALEQVHDEMPDNYAIALVVAHAHIDIGWAWRGTGWREEISPKNQHLFEAHFTRASHILDAFNPIELESPALAQARCALLAAAPRPKDRVADDYEDLIDLDPTNPAPMRAMGNHLLPRWFGSYATLDLEARRTASRTIATWGAGAYTWVYLDALAVDPISAHQLDTAFFIEGMRDNLKRQNSQHLANQMAAFCALTMAPDRCAVPLTADAKRNRAELHACLGMILADHLREVHPLIWVQASAGPMQATHLPSHAALLRAGYEQARHVIARHFASELANGTTVSFSKHGLRLYPAV